MSGKIVECLYSYFVAMGGQTVSEGSPSKDRQLLLLTETRKLLTSDLLRFNFIVTFFIAYYL